MTDASGDKVDVGIATAEDREACYRLAYEVFCEEVGYHRDKADHENRRLEDATYRQAEVLVARVDGEVVGSLAVLLGRQAPFGERLDSLFDVERFTGIVPRDEMAMMIRFAVRRRYRGTMVPFRLITAAADLLARGGRVTLAFCDCQPHLLPLYTSLGFRPYAPVIGLPGLGLMVPLVFVAPDLAHLRSLGTPLLPYVPAELEDPALAARIGALIPPDAPVQRAEALSEEAWERIFGGLSAPRERIAALDGLTPEEVRTLLEQAQVIELAGGQPLIVEGQAARTAYVVLEGEVEIQRQGRKIATCAAGELFGEFALLCGVPRTADVVAGPAPVRLAALNEKVLLRLIESRSPVAARLLWNVSRALAAELASRREDDQ
jgi:GNAT superfamily N-acetyltransferase